MRLSRTHVRRAAGPAVLVLLLCAGAWIPAIGLLPVAMCLTLLLAAHLGVLAFPEDQATTQWIGGATFVAAIASGGTRLFAAFGLARPPMLLGGLVAFVAFATWLTRRRHLRPSWALPPVIDASSAGFGFALVIASGLTIIAAYLLPVWQYDSLGYHLPFVNFILQEGSTRAVPDDLAYVGTYPHAIEWAYVAMRASLFDDRLIDLAQLPFGFLGAGAIFGIAKTFGARPASAFAAGVAWLALPAVLLQLPTNYIDVASAASYLVAVYFLLRPPSFATILTAATAAGLFLGSKPNAPLATILLGAVLIERAHRIRRYDAAAVGCGLVLLLGAESYVTGLLRWGNPVWPVQVDVGPIHLPGTETMQKVLSSGPATEKAHGPVLERVASSWSRLYATPVFDMRTGGLGPIGLLSLPIAAFFVVRDRRWLLGILWLGALASPDPAVCRYVLALPGIALAVVASGLEGVTANARLRLLWAGALTSIVSIAHASSGLHGEGPTLDRYWAMPWSERERSVGADGRPTSFVEMRNRLAEGDGVAFDSSLDLPYLVWRGDLKSRAVHWSRHATGDELAASITRDRIRFAVVADDSALVSEMGDRVTFLFRCKSAPCSAYEVR